MGFAMLWIVWFHAYFDTAFTPLFLLKSIGYGGVDIFLFASGIGCYLSLLRDPDQMHFYKRRILRIFPTYLCFIVVWLIWKHLSEAFPLTATWGNILGIQTLTGNENSFNWYLSAILLFYLLSPLLKDVTNSAKSLKQNIFIILFLISVSIPFWTNGTYTVLVTRLPIFYIGMLFGKYCSVRSEFPKKHILALLVLSVIGCVFLFCGYLFFLDYLWDYGLHWYPFILITPGLCIAISFILNALKEKRIGRFFDRVLSAVGKHSFEIFLMHLLVFEITQYLVSTKMLIPHNDLVWFAAILVSIAGSLLLKLVTRAITKRLPVCRNAK